jgi:hypothetical protein
MGVGAVEFGPEVGDLICLVDAKGTPITEWQALDDNREAQFVTDPLGENPAYLGLAGPDHAALLWYGYGAALLGTRAGGEVLVRWQELTGEWPGGWAPPTPTEVQG